MKSGPIKIIVTKEDIENGNVNDPFSCPITLAFCRELKLELADEIIEVLGEEVIIHYLTKFGARFYFEETKYSNRETINQFIEKFDNQLPVEPTIIEGVIRMEVVDELERDEQ